MSDKTQHKTLPEDRVSLFEKLAIGAGATPSYFGWTAVQTLANAMVMIVGLNPAAIGIALMLPRFWDAFSDPVMGRISDNSHQLKGGRRKPYIIAGAIGSGITFGLMWMIPEAWNTSLSLGVISFNPWIVSFLLIQLLFFTFFTVFGVPYTSLSYELTPDYYERTRVMAFTAAFTKFGELMVPWLAPIAVWFSVKWFGAENTANRQGFITMGWGAGLFIFILFGVIPGFGVRERFKTVTAGQEKVKIIPGLKQAFSNRAFLVLVAIMVFNLLSGMVAATMDWYVLTYYIKHGNFAEGSLLKAELGTGYAIIGWMMIPVVTWLAGKLEKRGALLFGYMIFIAACAVKWFIYSHNALAVAWSIPLGVKTMTLHPWLWLDPLMSVPLWTGVSVLLNSMMADICDDDELRFGNRREGTFGAAYSWISKFMVSVSMGLSGILIAWIGFDPNPEMAASQSERTLFIMRVLLVGAPALTAFFAIISLKFYPISARRAAETRKLLEARRGSANATEVRS